MIMSSCKNQGHLKRILLATTIFLIVAFLFTSCSSSDYSTQSRPSGMDKAMEDSGPPLNGSVNPVSPDGDESGMGETYYPKDPKSNDNINEILSSRKIIMDGEVSLETTGFDDSITEMEQLIKDFGGFAEVRNVTGKSQYSQNRRNATYVVRVPSDKFEIVLKSMGNIGTVLESDSRGTDITYQYYDTEARVNALKIQEETLLGILAKSTKLDDVITLESRISNVRYEIESLENTIRNYDRLIAFSRITVYIREVDDRTETKPIPKTLGDRISSSFNHALDDFISGCEDFIVWFAASWIKLLGYTIIIIISIIIYKRTKKRRMNKSSNAGHKNKKSNVTMQTDIPQRKISEEVIAPNATEKKDNAGFAKDTNKENNAEKEGKE